MLKSVKLKYFKRFKDDEFDLSDIVILAGPNNSGKSTLLQAISVWHLALTKWLAERDPSSGSKAKKRTGVAITRKDFTPIPLQEMNLLWTNCSTALSKKELPEGQKLGTPRLVEIRVAGTKEGDEQSEWELGMQFTYRHKDYVHARPADDTPVEPIKEHLRALQVVHVPPFSGIGVEEPRYDKAYQDVLIGQGKPGDILRNLLLEVHTGENSQWAELAADIRDVFRCALQEPQYNGGPYIQCFYGHVEEDERTHTKFDISSAGSGFLQVLMLLGFFYARPASVLLLDEPDAHLHVILQKQVYDKLRAIAVKRQCQLIIATHSEVLIDSTSPERILSFIGDHPHGLSLSSERDRVREAIKRLSTLDVIGAAHCKGILYLENETDYNLLLEWARILNHPSHEYLKTRPFLHYMRGSDPREAKGHFFAAKAVNTSLSGLVILDGDNRGRDDHEITADDLEIRRWSRYEIENYLVNAVVLDRFVRSRLDSKPLFMEPAVERGNRYLADELPPAVLKRPHEDHDYLKVTPASKHILPRFFAAVGLEVTKDQYYQIAALMQPDEIPNDVSHILDEIAKTIKG